MRLLVPSLLFGASVTLGAAIAYEVVAPLDLPNIETVRAPTRLRHVAKPIDFSPPAEVTFADIDAHPLFSAARKPLPDLVQTNGNAVATSDFSLVGVIMGSARAVALLRIKSTTSTTSASVGDIVNGWRVERIDATTVTLRANGSDFVVPLIGPGSQPPSAALLPLSPEASAPPLLQTGPAATRPQAAATPPQPAATPGAAPTSAVSTTGRPAVPAYPSTGTISPEALKGAPIDPSTGEPTL